MQVISYMVVSRAEQSIVRRKSPLRGLVGFQRSAPGMAGDHDQRYARRVGNLIAATQACLAGWPTLTFGGPSSRTPRRVLATAFSRVKKEARISTPIKEDLVSVD